MRPIGGEAPWQNGYEDALTDSGRSSLRLLLKSGLAGKRFAVPIYQCPSIRRVLAEFEIEIVPIPVNHDLTLNMSSIPSTAFDVLYVIHYFGQKQKLGHFALEPEQILLEDSVFLPDLKPSLKHERWAAFNSFRKVTSLADGSLCRATFPLQRQLAHGTVAPFAVQKYEAKALKARYLRGETIDEQAYVSLFQEAESSLDEQTEIFEISREGQRLLVEELTGMAPEQAVRREQFEFYQRELSSWSIGLKPEFFSFFLVRVPDRMAFQSFLYEQKLFLPIHWPDPVLEEDLFFSSLLSVPLHSRYNWDDCQRIVEAFRTFHGVN